MWLQGLRVVVRVAEVMAAEVMAAAREEAVREVEGREVVGEEVKGREVKGGEVEGQGSLTPSSHISCQTLERGLRVCEANILR